MAVNNEIVQDASQASTLTVARLPGPGKLCDQAT